MSIQSAEIGHVDGPASPQSTRTYEQLEGPPPRRMIGAKLSPRSIERARRSTPRGCPGHLVVAPLWVAYAANLGTLLRTCDAVGSCMAVPNTAHYRDALDQGDTLPRRPHIHWISTPKLTWVAQQRATGAEIMAVELAEDATPLAMLGPAQRPTVVLLGHERNGVPDEAWTLIDRVVEIPMVGVGSSLNVAIAGSLVLYRLAGLG